MLDESKRVITAYLENGFSHLHSATSMVFDSQSHVLNSLICFVETKPSYVFSKLFCIRYSLSVRVGCNKFTEQVHNLLFSIEQPIKEFEFFLLHIQCNLYPYGMGMYHDTHSLTFPLVRKQNFYYKLILIKSRVK